MTKHFFTKTLTSLLTIVALAGCFALFTNCSGLNSAAPGDPPIQYLEIEVKANGSDVKATERSGVAILNGDKLQLSQLSFISNNRLNIILFSGLSVADVINVQKDLWKTEHNTDIREAVIFIDSPGGDAFSGLGLAETIRIFREYHGWKISAEARGIVASAAVPIFAACRPRIAARSTIFMVHEAALWKWPGRETASDIRAQGELMNELRKQYMAILVANSNLDEDEWLLKEARTTWFSAEKGKEWGIIDVLQ